VAKLVNAAASEAVP